MANKKKAATTVVAVATAAALLLGGTFAWQSISQTALNEASDVINPGGRLHDDFNGSDKNVYVENFAEDEIFARVRFDEYFEFVMTHGTAAEKTEKITPTATKTDVDTYVTHIFGEENTTDEFWNWTMGSADSEPAYYMPTFNLNKDSLAADVNGVFNGANFTITDKDDGDQYVDTYVEWTDGAIKEGYEIYDGDTNNVDELSRDYGVLKELTTAVNDIIDTGTGSQYYNADNLVLTDAKEEHTAAQVNAETGFMSMQEWIDGGSQKGPYWVYDTDGWCYWAQPIPGKNNAAGEPNTTGLLMDGIALDEVMDDTWYYAINVVGQFITANDIGDGTAENPGFMQDGMTDAAKELLKEIGVDVDGTGGGSGGEGEYEYTQETIDELDVRTASMDVYRGTQYTIAYVYDGDEESASLYSVEMSSADGDHLSEVHCDGDEVIITVHPEEPNDTLTLTYTFDHDYSYEVEMTLNVLGDIGEDEGYLEPTDTLPVINITWSEGTGNTASATVYRGEIYDFAGFQYGGSPATVHDDTLELSGVGDEEARSYVGYDEYNNPLLVIEADEPNGTLLLTGKLYMDETIDFTITLTVLDSEGGGDDWMPEFTEDPNAAIESFTKYTDLVPDAPEYADCLYFAAGTYENDGPDPENITVQIFDKNGTPITLEDSEGRVAGTHQVQAYAIAPVPEGTAEGDKFTGVATWTVNGVTYGIAKVYYWVD